MGISKNRLFFILIVGGLMLLTVSSFAQSRGVFEVSGQNVEIVGDSLLIEFKIDAQKINVRPGEMLRFDLTLQGEERAVELPSVVYSSKQRANIDERDRILFGDDAEVVKPFHVYKGLNKKRLYSLQYSVKIPYEVWMDTAFIDSKYVRRNCCDDKVLGKRDLATLNLNPQVEVVEEWLPDPAVYTKMASFIAPEIDTVKSRHFNTALYLKYKDKSAKVLPDFEDNETELEKLETAMPIIFNSDFIDVESIFVTAFGSITGSTYANEIYTSQRAASFKEYIAAKYEIAKKDLINTEWVAKDWSGLLSSISVLDEQQQQDIRDFVAKYENLDRRERALRDAKNRAIYDALTDANLPEQERIELNIKYRVGELTDEQIGEYFYGYPYILTMSEMYRYASKLKSGKKEYTRACVAIAEKYPENVAVINNAAYAFILEGNVTEARKYLSKISDKPESFINQGVCCYFDENFEGAKAFFAKAVSHGYSQGEANIILLQKSQSKK